jgi:3-methyl-2-oxobutanoate hydroxymethyltransferase
MQSRSQVMGHVGLKPQSVKAMGGFTVQGKSEEAARRVIEDAKAIAAAGAFSIVVEGTLEPVARAIVAAVDVPIIGIGASPACDGQVLVIDDILGLFVDFTPKFVKRYAELAPEIEGAIKAYANEVRSRTFPTEDHCFGAKRGPAPKLIMGLRRNP